MFNDTIYFDANEIHKSMKGLGTNEELLSETIATSLVFIYFKLSKDILNYIMKL